MKQIIKKEGAVYWNDVDDSKPIFVKEKDRFVGMLVYNYNFGNSWIIAIGKGFGATGYHQSLVDCLESGLIFGYTYYIED